MESRQINMRIINALLAVAMMLATLASCGSGKKPETPRILVLYYSQTATTRTVAEAFAAKLQADIEAIVPEVPYDGSYQETIQRGREELQESKFPALKPLAADLAAYDVIFLGYPIWFGTYANPIATLIEENDFSGKKIVPFCSFGSGGLESSAKNLADRLPESEILPGYGVRAARIDAAPAEVERFLKAGGFLPGDADPLPEFPASHPVSEEEAAIFDAAVGDYPMINASAATVSSRPVPEGTEYRFTAIDRPRESSAQQAQREITVYVLASEGEAPVFTRVVRP